MDQYNHNNRDIRFNFPYDDGEDDLTPRRGRQSGETPKDNRRRRRTRRIIAWLWGIFAFCVVAVFIFFILIYNGVIGYMPDLDKLENPDDRYASVIYSADGKEMGRFYRNTGNRIYADYADISQHVIDALISTEDSRFEQHSGIDGRAFGRVLLKTIIMRNENAGGGSTLTQQLAKQLYSPDSHGKLRRALQKPVEWMIALKLERLYSKEEILKMYLNQFDFLYNAVGIRSAAKIYFDKDAKDLDIAEAALLVGMVKNPSYYNPVRYPERALQRRNTVIDQMVKNDKLSKVEAEQIKRQPITLHFNRVDHNAGIAPYFREELRRMLTAKKPERSNYSDESHYLADVKAWEEDPLFGWVEKNPKPDGTKWDIYTDGLRIYATIDSRMQQYAEEAVHEHMTELQKKFFREKKGVKGAPYTTNRNELDPARIDRFIASAIKQSDRYRLMKQAGLSEHDIENAFNTPRRMTVFSYEGPVDTIMSPRDSIIYLKHFLRTGFMSMDPHSGHVKAYVGGPDYNNFKYDMVSTGRRQVGSTIKPYLYAYAMDAGFTPCDEFLNSQPSFVVNGRTWAPRNAGKTRIDEMVSLRWALTNSNNWISARLLNELSPQTFVRYLRSFGITGDIDPVLSLCLGSCDISVKEMVSGYSTFANNGMRTTPVFVTHIEDSEGNVISEFRASSQEVLSRQGNDRILSMILSVVDSGTGNRLRRAPYNITAQTGGKTGTTNFNSDGWFMAVTPDLVSGTWVGGEERYIHFNAGVDGQGSAMALPIYGRYIRKVYDDRTLPYRQDSKFNISSDLCSGQEYDTIEVEDVEETIEGVFD